MAHEQLEDRIDEIQRELGLMEEAYSRSKERLEGRDTEWETRKTNLIRQVCELVGQFKIGDEPHKAVAIVAQCAVMAAELRAPELWVTKYEERKAMLRMARQQQERQAELMEKARLAVENEPWMRRASGI